MCFYYTIFENKNFQNDELSYKSSKNKGGIIILITLWLNILKSSKFMTATNLSPLPSPQKLHIETTCMQSRLSKTSINLNMTEKEMQKQIKPIPVPCY